MKHLMPMTDFVININNLFRKQIDLSFDLWRYKQFLVIIKYAEFLKQPLKLGMFVTCDESGNVLETPINPNQIEPQPMLGQNEYNNIVSEWETYQKAKSKVLFKGFSYCFNNNIIWFIKDDIKIFEYNRKNQMFSAPSGKLQTIDDLVKHRLELTESAIKKIGL